MPTPCLESKGSQSALQGLTWAFRQESRSQQLQLTLALEHWFRLTECSWSRDGVEYCPCSLSLPVHLRMNHSDRPGFVC